MPRPPDTAAGTDMTADRVPADAADTAPSAGRQHIGALVSALTVLDTRLLDDWGRRLAVVLRRGGRLLVAGNGGSAAQAQQLAAEFTGRFGGDRGAYSALALHAETSTVTAIASDCGYDEVCARQVRGHGRPGDVLLALSTSGRNRNLLRAVSAARGRAGQLVPHRAGAEPARRPVRRGGVRVPGRGAGPGPHRDRAGSAPGGAAPDLPGVRHRRAGSGTPGPRRTAVIGHGITELAPG
jgi:phosphoheptose isomerase